MGSKDVEGNHPFRMKEIKDGKLVNFIDRGFRRYEAPTRFTKSLFKEWVSFYLTSLDNIYRGKY